MILGFFVPNFRSDANEHFDSSQRAIHSPRLRPGTGSLKTAGAPSSCGSTDWPARISMVLVMTGVVLDAEQLGRRRTFISL
jgi:hypothetical protein